MNDLAIRVDHLSKRYRIGGQRAHYRTLRESLVAAAKAPLRWLKGGRPPTHNEFWALDDVSFEVKHGEVVGIIGRNGAGKSTLLKILSRITKPTRGRVDLYGRVGSLLEVDTGFHPELTGWENIYLNGAILGLSRREIERKFDEIVDFAEVERFLDTQVKFYSSGMYVRLAFAVAAHLEPEILVVDEVLAVGDVEFQAKSLGKMNEVAGGGRTVLFVSHNMGAVANLCKRAILLKDGRIESVGTARQVIEKYLLNANLSSSICFSRDVSQEKKAFFSNVSILNSEGLETSQVSLMEGFTLRVKYKIMEAIKGIKVSFRIRNYSGIYVLGSSDIDLNPIANLGKLRQPGEYTSHCKISRQFLRPGRYSIDLWIGYPGISTIDEHEQAILFEVVDTGSVEAAIGEGSLSVISPLLAWSTGYEKLAQ